MIYTMSFNRQKLTQKIENLADNITEHLVKLLVVDADTKLIEHWQIELNAWLGRIATLRLKGTNKLAPQELVYKELTDIALYDNPELYVTMCDLEYASIGLRPYYKSHLKQLQDAVRAILLEFSQQSSSGSFKGRVEHLKSFQDAFKLR